MTASELKIVREAMRLDLPSMAVVLGLPYNTLRSYEYDHRPIPPHVADTARQAQQRDRQFMADLTARLHADLDRLYPGGIPSEPVTTEITGERSESG